MNPVPRYALYAVPDPGSALARFAARWLCWDIERAETPEPPATAGLPPAVHLAVTAEPRRYGFHGTLKAPFHLAADESEANLVAAIASFAAAQTSIPALPLHLRALGSFLALVPRDPAPALHALAAAAVDSLDRFRAPLSEAERARRQRAPLSAAQEALLERWGYPYVMQEFRFHMTLTGPLDKELRSRVSNALEPTLAPLLGEYLRWRDVALCVEPAPGTRFRVLRRFALGQITD